MGLSERVNKIGFSVFERVTHLRPNNGKKPKPKETRQIINFPHDGGKIKGMNFPNRADISKRHKDKHPKEEVVRRTNVFGDVKISEEMRKEFKWFFEPQALELDEIDTGLNRAPSHRENR
jgi:hypothetical protein